MAHVSHQKKHSFPRLFDYASPDLDKFGIVLLLTSALLIVLLLVDLHDTALVSQGLLPIVVAVSTAVVLTFSLRATGIRHRYSLYINLFLLLGLIVTAISTAVSFFLPEFSYQLPPSSMQPLWVIVAIVTPVATIYRLLQHRVVTTRTLAAAVAAYLQIAIAFTFVFLLLDDLSGGFFAEPQPSTNFMYYSVITISTVGYGDLTAVSSIGHALSAVEAVLGQIYLVVVVAMLVGLYTSNRQPLAPQQKKSSSHKQ